MLDSASRGAGQAIMDGMGSGSFRLFHDGVLTARGGATAKLIARMERPGSAGRVGRGPWPVARWRGHPDGPGSGVALAL